MDSGGDPYPHPKFGHCFNGTVDEAKGFCNEYDECGGFFTYDNMKSAYVCFKKYIDVEQSSDQFISVQPNAGTYVKQ
mgnify:CR=1 FL=1